VNRWWHLAISTGVSGAPTRYLDGFDPKATPAAMVAAERGKGTAEIVAELQASDRDLVALVAGLDADGWAALAEAPPGHLPVTLVVHHALWDCWVHERDVLLPLGIVPAEEDDELLASLRYAAALGPALLDGSAAFVVDVVDPGTRFVVEASEGDVRLHDGEPPAGAPSVRGRAVDVVEVLSVRTPPSGNACPEATALAAALAEAFS
jgi:hypothetical protein